MLLYMNRSRTDINGLTVALHRIAENVSPQCATVINAILEAQIGALEALYDELLTELAPPKLRTSLDEILTAHVVALGAVKRCAK